MKKVLLIICAAILFLTLFPQNSICGWTHYNVANSNIADTVFNTLYTDSNGYLWAGTYSAGAYRFDRNSEWIRYRKELFQLINNNISDITKDAAGNMWFVTLAGASRLSAADSSWRSFAELSGLPSIDINRVAADQGGDIWFGLFGAGLAQFREDTVIANYNVDSGLPDDRILSLFYDGADFLWIGTYEGVARFDLVDQWRIYNTQNSQILDDTVNCILQDELGNMWFGTRTGLSKLKTDSTWDTYDQSDGMAKGYVQAISIDSSGNIWLGHRFDPGDIDKTLVSEFDGLSIWTIHDIDNDPFVQYVSVKDIVTDRDGDIWFTTNGEGIARYTPEPTDIDDPRENVLPDGYHLSQNYPNPFNAGTVIEFSLPGKTHVNIAIFNLLGQKVITLTDGIMSSGIHRIGWDGYDKDGREAATGLYFYRIKTDDFQAIKKMVILK